jgi:hypothetical protein
MIRLVSTLFPKSLVAAAAGAGIFVAGIGDASACDGKRGGFYRPAFRPVYQQPYCQQPVQPYVQPQFQQPQFQQPMLPQEPMIPPQVQQLLPHGEQLPIQGQEPFVPGQQVQGQQVMQGQQALPQGQQVMQGQRQVMPGQQVIQQSQQAQGQQFQQVSAGQQVVQRPVQSGAVVTQGTSVAAMRGGSSGPVAGTSAIGALGGSAAGAPSQNLAAPSQNLAAPAQGNVAAPDNSSALAGAPAANAPAASAPAAGDATQAPSNQTEQSAMESALQALMGETAPVTTQAPAAASGAQPVTAAPQAAPIGEFSATLTSGTTVRLSLRADGSFVWVATKGDKVSTFQGTFAFGGTSLTLHRSSDNQKLEGSLAMTGSGFKLQLGGQNAEGLNFIRA